MGLSPDVLYRAVYDDVSPWCGMVDEFQHVPFPGCSYKQYASSYLLHSVIRKWIPSDAREADAKAYEAFTEANNSCKDWFFNPRWEIDIVVLGEIRRILDDFFHPGGKPLISSYFDLLKSGRPGPGVNIGAEGTSFYTKYLASPLSTTSLYLYEEYKNYSDWIPFLSEAECLRYEKFGSPSVVSGSRASFVPKTSKSSRMICIEPTLNMFYQLGLAAHLERRLGQYFGIDLARQPEVNHALAREGSISGKYSTIDLSSASDSISLRLCELVLPGWFFELLLVLRSRTCEVKSKQVPLFMVSTMGNGFTFPLQTIIFSAIIKAVTNIFGSPDFGWSCFGDDIICRREIFDRLVHYLALFNFKVNLNKTFSEGPFRESCGSDWFLGQPVRPVFCRKLDLPYDIMVTLNQLNDWSSYTGIPLRNAVRVLLKSLAPKFRNFVPFDSSYDSGIRVPLALASGHSYDGNLSFVYKTWERRPSRLTISEGGVRSPDGFSKTLWFNPPGLYCSFLFGELRSLSIMVRHDRKMFRKRLRCSPYWDYIPTGSRTNGVRLSWQQWETAVAINLAKT